jgi:hypothetical protein
VVGTTAAEEAARAARRAELARLHAALLAAYRAALRHSESTSGGDQAMVRHVVAVSSGKAARRLRTREHGVDDLADTLKSFSEDVAREDRLGGIFGYVTGQATDLVGILGLIASVSLVGALAGMADGLARFFAATEAVGAAVGQWVVRAGLGVIAIRLGWLLLRGLASYWHAVAGLYQGPAGVRVLLAVTLDAPEQEFFAALNAERPRRALLAAVGPAAATALIVCALLPAFFVGRGLLGAVLAPRPAPNVYLPGSVELFLTPVAPFPLSSRTGLDLTGGSAPRSISTFASGTFATQAARVGPLFGTPTARLSSVLVAPSPTSRLSSLLVAPTPTSRLSSGLVAPSPTSRLSSVLVAPSPTPRPAASVPIRTPPAR